MKDNFCVVYFEIVHVHVQSYLPFPPTPILWCDEIMDKIHSARGKGHGVETGNKPRVSINLYKRPHQDGSSPTLKSLQPQDWMVEMDIKDVYTQIPD